MPTTSDLADLTQLPDDRIDAVCRHLHLRFDNDKIYTYIGHERMVILNPCKPMPLSNNDDTLQYYINHGYKDLTITNNGYNYNTEPHIYDLATRIYFIMRRRMDDQLVLLSGISGSGKSTSHQQLSKAILNLSTHTRREDKLQRQITSAMTVLEAFGSIHATTSTQIQHSNNRFNLCHSLQFNERGHIVGSYFATSLFDKYHLTRSNTTSNYHIFYQLLAGTSPEEKAALHINYSMGHFVYLKHTTRYKDTSEDSDGENSDQNKFIKVKEALKILGLKAKLIAQICQLLGAILHLGNVQFIDGRGPLSVLTSQSTSSSGQESCRVKNKDTMALVAAALGVATTKLENTLTHKLKLIGKEFCSAFLTVDAAMVQRDSLAQSLYSLLFHWIVQYINNKLSSTSYANRITVVDFMAQMGGIIDENNSNGNQHQLQQCQRHGNFHDLCTHFATEQIHQWVLYQDFDADSPRNISKWQDGLSTSPSPSPDFFQSSIPLWSGSNKFVMVPSLNRDCQRFQAYALDATDTNWLVALFQKKKRQGDNINGPFTALQSPKSPSASFAIQHFCTTVEYSVEGFLEANVDAFSPDFIHLFRYNCTNSFVRDLFLGNEQQHNQQQQVFEKKQTSLDDDDDMDGYLHDKTSIHNYQLQHESEQRNQPRVLLTECHPRDDRTIIKAQLPTQPPKGWLGVPINSMANDTKDDTIVDGGESKTTMDQQENDKALSYISTVAHQMVHSMQQLLRVFDETPNLYEVIHIQPNPAQQPGLFDEAWIMHQLEAYKVADYTQRQRWCETIYDYTHDEFTQRYQYVISTLTSSPTILPSETTTVLPEQQIEMLRDVMQWTDSQCILGREKIWLRFDVWHDLENQLRLLEKEARQREKERQAQLEMERKAEQEELEAQRRQAELEAEALAQAESELTLANAETIPDMATMARRGSHGTDRWSHSNPFADDCHSNWSSDDHTAHDKSEWGEDDDAKGLAEAFGPNMDMSQMVEDYQVYHEELIEEVPISSTRQWWSRFVWFATWCIPSFTLRWIGKMQRQDVQMAWREKVTLCLLIFLFSGSIIFVIVGLNQIICPGTKYIFSANDVSAHQTINDYWVSAHGQVYDLTKFVANDHGTSTYMATRSTMEPLAGRDLSYTFPVSLTTACSGLVTDNSINIVPNETIVLGPFVHFSGPQQPDKDLKALQDPLWLQHRFQPLLEKYKKGDLVIPMKQLHEDFQSYGRLAVSIHEKVYDLTDYMNSARRYPQGSIPNYHFLHPSIERLFTTFAGSDATQAWDQMTMDSTLRQKNLDCLDNSFYVGKLDYRETTRCTFVNYLLLSFAVVMSVVILVKFLAALQFGGAPNPEEQDKFVICQVPCYTEDEESLRKTIESITVMQYDDRRKLLLLIADGMIIGSGNEKPTPCILLDILGHNHVRDRYGDGDDVDDDNDHHSYTDDDTTEPFMFKSIGEGSQQLNYGKVYSGLYQHEGHVVPYVVVVKVGKSSERTKPGNRGKRDSQIICMNFLNKVHFDAPMNPLELEMYRHIRHIIGIDPALYEYILMVDSDTEVYPDALTRMIACMLHDSRIIGLCGETELCNEDRSWATRIQVYEYYISHHLVKAFESLFGSVTCLPGCFCMYRIRTPHKRLPLIVSPQVIHGYSDNQVDTLHKKNLLHLGEDRYLTTLVMKNFPQYKMMFTPYAKCRTVAPDEWRVLLSQRRRWINSTIHNLLELVMLQELCGFCCLSMRFVVMTDLIGTITLPSSVVYLIYLIYESISGTGPLPVIALGMLAGAYGLQALIFIIKREWQHIGWMVIYVLAIPIFSFFIPIYAFWHFDDFSWGNTRVVVGDNKKKQIIVTDGEKFDEKMIPLKKWAQHEQWLWEQKAAAAAAAASRARSMKSSICSSRKRNSSTYDNDNDNNDKNWLLQPLIMDFSVQGDNPFSLGDFSTILPNEKNNMTDDCITGSHTLEDNDGDGMAHSMEPLVVLPEDDDIEREIKKILTTTNLMHLTKKQVRDQLSQLFGVDLTIKKGFINATIESFLEAEYS
ncbi:chitin synthase [Halteromyces radiatus]|uniref:chitin synthase n=1 Tax=Halteromyces radiatus TaxID=101107 RepID=UPI00221E5385|nr:chitin synthase [Halteromyces radiatus]KAI8093064.1 chitin synthase [Halteromyces radiatus]